MARLYRPSIPVEVRCRVVLRQLGELFPDDAIRANRFVPRVSPPRSLARLLDDRLPKLADLLGCDVKSLRLDHDPALENRRQIRRDGNTGEFVGYSPSANDPDFLIYREKHDHHIKTNVRGEHGQFPDNTIAKRERRRQKKAQKKQCARCFAGYRIPPSKLCGRCQKVAMKYREKVKRKWPSRQFPTGRKLRSRP